MSKIFSRFCISIVLFVVQIFKIALSKIKNKYYQFLMRCEKYVFQKFVKFAVLKSFQIFYRASRWLQRGCVYSVEKKNRVQSVTESVFPFPSHLTTSNKFRPRYRREYPDIVSAQPVHTRQAYGLFNFIPSRVRSIRRHIQTAIARPLCVWDPLKFFGMCFGEGKGRDHYSFPSRFLNARYPGRRQENG